MRKLSLPALALMFSLPAFAAAPPPISTPSGAKIIRTEHSIPNIIASDIGGMGYGVGFAQAEDNICALADMWVRLEGRRRELTGSGSVESDLFNKYMNGDVGTTLPDDPGAVESYIPWQTLIENGVSDNAWELVDGFVFGYNEYLQHYLANVDNDASLDGRCKGHVRPIGRADVLRRMYELVGKASRDLVWTGMVKAEPPGLTDRPRVPSTIPLYGRIPVVSDLIDEVQDGIDAIFNTIPSDVDSENNGDSSPFTPDQLIELGEAFGEWIENGGSNAVAFGADATDNGSGALLGNPHWGWDGQDKFWQMHVKIDNPNSAYQTHVSGMGFIGQPLVMIGHNEHVAWSHTVSAARRLALVQLQLVPGNPTQYVVDGEIHDMDQRTVTIKDKNGTTHSKTFYSSIYGPITTSILGIDLLPWTQATAFAVVDMNYDSARIADQFLENNNARSVDELYAIHAKYSANPWATTTAADDQGNTLWTDVGTVPNISNEFAAACNTAAGHALWNTFAVAVLNGATLQCEIPTTSGNADPLQNSAHAKTMPAALQPVLKRSDYVENSNESHWLTNAHEPLEGYSRVFGPERSQRAFRTRMGHSIILDRLEGRDGASKTTFDRQDIQDALFNNRNKLGEIWADDLATYCDNGGGTWPTQSGEMVDVSDACDVIRNWDRTNNLDSPGAVLWARFSKLAYADLEFALSYAGVPSTPMFVVPFNPLDPVNTPHGLNPDWAPAYAALAQAVKDLQEANIPLDATLRYYQTNSYGNRRFPLHGGKGELGLFNALSTSWAGNDPNYPGFRAGGGGASFIQVTSFGDGCPDDRTLLNGSQRSPSSGWPRATDQAELYSQKLWVNPPFCDDELAAEVPESVTILGAFGSDSDGDGVSDDVDNCPNEAGSAGNAGCPLPDSDDDGIADVDDDCPGQAGPSSSTPGENGCPAADPDGDGDGVADSVDACPDTAGTDGRGCPVSAGEVTIAQFTSVSNPASNDVTGGPVEVTFTVDASSSDPNAGALSYVYYFGDGEREESETNSAVHSYSRAGDYTVTVIVTDDAQNTAVESLTLPMTTTLSIDNTAPVEAVLSVDTGGNSIAPVTAVFDASGSNAPVRSIYTFDFGDGSDPVSGTDQLRRHVYAAAGTYTATVTVQHPRDPTNTSTATANLTVKPVQETTAVFVVSPTEAEVGEVIKFDARDSIEVDPIVSFTFDFDDGTVVERSVAEFGEYAGFTTHAYSQPRVYTPSVVANTSSGKKSKAKATLRVKPSSAPRAGTDTPPAAERPQGRASGSLGWFTLLLASAGLMLRRRRQT